MDIEATRSENVRNVKEESKIEFSKEEEAERNDLLSNGLSMRLIDRKKIEYDQFEEALSITKSQINTILQFNHKNEALSLKFLNQTLLSMESLLKEMQDYQRLIKEEKQRTRKDLEELVGNQIKYSNKNLSVEEEIMNLSLSEKELEDSQSILLEKINEKKLGLEALLNLFDQELFNQVKTLLSQRLPIIWQVQEILIGILMKKERATTQEIQDAYSSYEGFLKIIRSKFYENYSPISAGNTYKNIEAMDSEISKVAKPENAELNRFLERFIDLIKLLCELAILSNNYKSNSEKLLNMKTGHDEKTMKSKRILIPEINLLIEQIKGFDSILLLLDSNIKRKLKEMESINIFILDLQNHYNNDLQKDIPESFKQEVCMKQDINQ